MPSPPLAVALVFKQRLVHPETIDVEGEAMASAAMICGRNAGLTLGPLVACYREYWGKLPEDDGIFDLLKERYTEVATEMDEVVLGQVLETATLPSQARALIRQGARDWGAPEVPFIEDLHLFPACEARVQELKKVAEYTFTARLEFATTRFAIQKLTAEVDLELGDGHTPLTARLLRARESHKERMEMEVHSNFGWPPKGKVVALAHAARWFATELGRDHLSVQDFLAALLRELKRVEAEAEEALRPFDAAANELRRRLAIQPQPPKLIKQALEAELAAILDEVEGTLTKYKEELAYESPTVLRWFSSISREAFWNECHREAVSLAQQLRRSDPDKPEEEPMRQEWAVQLYQISEMLQAQGVAGVEASTELAAEFERELEQVRNLIPLTRPDLSFTDQEPDDGWHMPPDYREVDQPLGTPEPPFQPRIPTPPPPTPPETPRPDIAVSMKLHSVCLEDTKARSQIVLMERCAIIIAEECGIPREWITHIDFAPPEEKKLPPPAETIPEEDSLSDPSRSKVSSEQ
eukprot:TRINITY_DN50822_c0_g1_i1.p1 TRINITY_DN50822_c0_g1~~TRINITY_DN50822_c0_g1_i1.p1  ORF type:complete len:585 (-),score=130.60 TRINITY_DN50822_c0_g1_i1:77-1648(-)